MQQQIRSRSRLVAIGARGGLCFIGLMCALYPVLAVQTQLQFGRKIMRSITEVRTTGLSEFVSPDEPSSFGDGILLSLQKVTISLPIPIGRTRKTATRPATPPPPTKLTASTIQLELSQSSSSTASRIASASSSRRLASASSVSSSARSVSPQQSSSSVASSSSSTTSVAASSVSSVAAVSAASSASTELVASSTLLVPYAGAKYEGDGTFNKGKLGHDTDERGIEFYRWVTQESIPQDYDIITFVALPETFTGWNNPGISIDIRTSSTDVEKTHLGILVLDSTGSKVALEDYTVSPTSNWFTKKIALAGGTFTPGSQFTLHIRAVSTASEYADVGPVTLHWND